MRPTALPARSVNHRLPSLPTVMSVGCRFENTNGYSVTCPAVVIRADPVPRRAHLGEPQRTVRPAVIPSGPDDARGKTNSVISPAVVIRPIRLPVCSVNHSAPSGPAVIPPG